MKTIRGHNQGIEGRAARNGRTVQEESDIEEENRRMSDEEGRTRKSRASDGSSARRNSHQQGFASMPKEQVREIGIMGRAKRFGRSFEEESDLEEENKKEREEGEDEGENRYSKRSEQGKSGTKKRKSSGDNYNKQRHGKQGFASMPKEEAEKIQLMGRASRNHRSEEEESDIEEENKREREEGIESPDNEARRVKVYKNSHKQGFASMPKEKVKEIGIKGRAKRFGRSEEEESDLEEENERERKQRREKREGKSHKQGFAAMPYDKVVELGIMGRAKQFGRSFEEESDLEEENRERNEGHKEYKKSRHSDGRRKGGFAAMPHDKVVELGIMGRAKRFGRSFEEESDLEEENKREREASEDEGENRSSKRKEYGRHYSHGKQGFASMPKEEAEKIQLKGRASRNRRSEEEESDIEEDNKRKNRYSQSESAPKKIKVY